jgi:hypothetical protein
MNRTARRVLFNTDRHYSDHIGHFMAMGVDWRNLVCRSSSILYSLVLGTISLDHLFVNIWTAISDRHAFSLQLDLPG